MLTKQELGSICTLKSCITIELHQHDFVEGNYYVGQDWT